MPKVRRPIVRASGQPPRPSVNLLEPLRRLQAAVALRERNGSGASAPSSGRVILFVSPDPGDGKSTIAADLALVQRDAGERVVLVEANFRRPVQSRLLGLEGDGRLADVLTGRLNFDDGSQRVPPTVPPDYRDGRSARRRARDRGAVERRLAVRARRRSLGRESAGAARPGVRRRAAALARASDSTRS